MDGSLQFFIGIKIPCGFDSEDHVNRFVTKKQRERSRMANNFSSIFVVVVAYISKR